MRASAQNMISVTRWVVFLQLKIKEIQCFSSLYSLIKDKHAGSTGLYVVMEIGCQYSLLPLETSGRGCLKTQLENQILNS